MPYSFLDSLATRRDTDLGSTDVDRAYRFTSPLKLISYLVGRGNINVPKKSKPPSPVALVPDM